MWFRNCVKKLLNLLGNFFNFHAYTAFYGLKSTDIFKPVRLIDETGKQKTNNAPANHNAAV